MHAPPQTNGWSPSSAVRHSWSLPPDTSSAKVSTAPHSTPCSSPARCPSRRVQNAGRVLRTPVAYPVVLLEYEQQRRELERGLPVAGLHSIGRNGEFAHILMEDVYWRTLDRIHRWDIATSGAAASV